MRLEEQVVPPELATTLKALGVPQTSAFSWALPPDWQDNDREPTLCDTQHAAYLLRRCEPGTELVAAFTVAELGVLLGGGFLIDLPWSVPGNGTPDEPDVWFAPKVVARKGEGLVWHNWTPEADWDEVLETCFSEAEARGQLLRVLIEGGFVKARKLPVG